jgi:hypothetical protein
MYARRVFYKIDTTSPLNPEAAVLYVTLTLLLRINSI